MSRYHRAGSGDLSDINPGKIEWPVKLTSGEVVYVEAVEKSQVPNETLLVDSDTGERYRLVKQGEMIEAWNLERGEVLPRPFRRALVSFSRGYVLGSMLALEAPPEVEEIVNLDEDFEEAVA